MADKKRYVVREGEKVGIFEERGEVQGLVSGVKGAKYKSFKTFQQAEIAFQEGRELYYQPQKKWYEKRESTTPPFHKKSIAVDAACSSASGEMEYQGVDLVSKKLLFHQKFSTGTNNIGEFLALVHGLSYLQKENKTDYVLYSDSKIAINRIYQGKCKTNFPVVEKDQKLFAMIVRAENWLKNNSFCIQILKRNTKERGEIPADFRRK